MASTRDRALRFALAALVVALAGLSAWLVLELASLRTRLAFAEDQITVFEETRERALGSDAVGAADCLEYVVGYYPSGTKQEAGSRLDRMVEVARARVVRDIIRHLQEKTGQDLGDDPQKWIERFARR